MESPIERIIPFGNAKALEEAIAPNTVAFLVEILDGIIQTGLGRTGKPLAERQFQNASGRRTPVIPRARPRVGTGDMLISAGHRRISAVVTGPQNMGAHLLDRERWPRSQGASGQLRSYAAFQNCVR